MGISFIVFTLIGIILYFFFGRRTRKNRNIWQKSLDQLTKRSMIEFAEQKQLELSTDYQRLIQLFMNQNLALPLKTTLPKFYVSGYEFFPALFATISKAKHHITHCFLHYKRRPFRQIAARHSYR